MTNGGNGTPRRFDKATCDRIVMLVRAGNHVHIAAAEAGVTKQLLYYWRTRAKAGVPEYVEFFEQLEIAEASSEARDVVTMAKAASVDPVRVPCGHCNRPVELSADQALALTAQIPAIEAAQRVRSSAAQVALQRLQHRFPKRWSPRVIHEVSEAHDRFLDVAARVLAPEAFEALLSAYIESESEPAAPDAETGARRIH